MSTQTHTEIDTLDQRWRFVHRLPGGDLLALRLRLGGDPQIIRWSPKLDEVVGRITLQHPVTQLTVDGRGRRALIQHDGRLRVLEIAE